MDFRRWITALAVLALFAGLASAQVGGGSANPFQCQAVAQVTPTIRGEGITELVGDIVLTCTGGTSIAEGLAIPQANVVVSLTAPVTSRGTAAAGSLPTPSEALLLVDEPQSGLAAPIAGFGPAATQNLCTTPASGCTAFSRIQLVGTTPYATAATAATGTPVAAANVFQGLAAGNQITFNGVPIQPPGTASSRVYRITNIRVNASGGISSVVSGVNQVQAIISTNGATSIPLSLPQVTVGYIATSLTTSVSPTSRTFTQCLAQTAALPSTGNITTLRFTESFGAAFKTRVVPTVGGTLAYNPTTEQFRPGALYTSESGLVVQTTPALTIGTIPAGQADFGTRLQAVFSNFPAGATIYVTQLSTNAFTGTLGGTVAAPAAVLVSGAAAAFPTTVPTAQALVALTPGTDGTATAVWEVVNSSTTTAETFEFGVFISYTPNASLTTPTLGQSLTVNLNYAPQQPPNTTSIPRFSRLATAHSILNIIPCRTVLLFPYVTSADGFDTGIAISNTAEDPAGTRTAVGYCKLNFYGKNAPTNLTAATSCVGSTSPLCMGPLGPVNATATPAVYPTGAMLASGAASAFTGYVFAVCDFQFAHGFAFVSDTGARNLAMGYLALIMSDPSDNLWSIRASDVTGEALNQ